MISQELLGALQAAAPGIGAAVVLVRAFGARATALALGVAFWATQALVTGIPEWPWALWAGTNDGRQWLVWGVFSAALLATLAAWRPVQSRAMLALAPALIGICVWLVLTNVRLRESALQTAAKVGLGSLGSIALWAATRPLLVRRPGLLVPLGYSAVFGADGWLLLDAGAASLGQLAGACSAVTGTAAALAWARRRDPAFDRELALPLALAHGGLLLAGHELAELSTVMALVALCVPGLLWLAVAAGPHPR